MVRPRYQRWQERLSWHAAPTGKGSMQPRAPSTRHITASALAQLEEMHLFPYCTYSCGWLLSVKPELHHEDSCFFDREGLPQPAARLIASCTATRTGESCECPGNNSMKQHVMKFRRQSASELYKPNFQSSSHQS